MKKFFILNTAAYSMRSCTTYDTSSLDEAYEFCESLTKSHYENFPVASVLLPHSVRDYIYPVYAFARIADDIADEDNGFENSVKLSILDEMSASIDKEPVYPGNPIFIALDDVRNKFNLPSKPFQDLITAFKSDVQFRQPETLDDVYYYCRHSANPVGEIILRLFNNYDETTAKYSDMICTGLQLLNFWQDLFVDYDKGRIYIPLEILQKYGLNEKNLFDSGNSINLRNCLNELLITTGNLLTEGRELLKHIKSLRLRLELSATVNGGLTLLDKLQRIDWISKKQRLKLGKFDFLKIFIKSVINVI